MVRTQIQLTDDQARLLKVVASERGVSMAAVIRDAVDRAIEDAPLSQRRRVALAVVGRHRSGSSDIATDHDRHFADGLHP